MVVTTDGNSNSGVSKVTQLWIGTTGAETQVTATAAEINRLADKTASIVDITGASVTLTEATHGDRIITLSRAAGVEVTLPAATGTGNVYFIVVATAITSGSHVVKVANGTDVFDGSIAIGVDTDAEGATGYTWYAVAGDDTITLNGASQGGEVGDVIEVIDYKAGFFLLRVRINQSGGGEATPWSSGV